MNGAAEKNGRRFNAGTVADLNMHHGSGNDGTSQTITAWQRRRLRFTPEQVGQLATAMDTLANTKKRLTVDNTLATYRKRGGGGG